VRKQAAQIVIQNRATKPTIKKSKGHTTSSKNQTPRESTKEKPAEQKTGQAPTIGSEHMETEQIGSRFVSVISQ
jgi:hypothetical protein